MTCLGCWPLLSPKSKSAENGRRNCHQWGQDSCFYCPMRASANAVGLIWSQLQVTQKKEGMCFCGKLLKIWVKTAHYRKSRTKNDWGCIHQGQVTERPAGGATQLCWLHSRGWSGPLEVVNDYSLLLGLKNKTFLIILKLYLFGAGALLQICLVQFHQNCCSSS